MISTFIVKNVALIESAQLIFEKGLNVISGETGSGKSILIDSLNFVLGDRADRSLIRNGADSASVEVTFININNKNVFSLLDDYGIDFEDEIIIFRMMNLNGRNECRINGRMVTVSQIRNLVSLLVDVHLQHQNQFLLDEQNHIDIFDEYIGDPIKNILIEYANQLSSYKQLIVKLENFGSPEQRQREIEQINYEINEIELANVTENEEEILVEKRNVMQNHEIIIQTILESINYLDGPNEFMGLNSLNSSLRSIKSLEKFSDSYNDIYNRLESSIIEIDDIVASLKDKLSNMEVYDKLSLDKINERIYIVRKIKKKYGSNKIEIDKYLNEIKLRFDTLLNSEEQIKSLEIEKIASFNKLKQIAQKINDMRISYASNFSKDILDNLYDLDMKHAKFQVKIDFKNPNIIDNYLANGLNNLYFLISPNLGEPLKPLSKIISGGEMSRLMVGLKSITADYEHIDTLVFDEIDTGISGAVARTFSKKLFNIARKHQLISVTHLPQIAAMADKHYIISKNINNNKTITNIDQATEEDSIHEIMRLSGSILDSKAGFESAKELRKWAIDYKKTQADI